MNDDGMEKILHEGAKAGSEGVLVLDIGQYLSPAVTGTKQKLQAAVSSLPNLFIA